mgnify:CR=1 FL=1
MKDKLKIQIIGWLLLIISLLISGSMIGYDLTEEPTLVAQKINNPFNILGVYIGSVSYTHLTLPTKRIV